MKSVCILTAIAALGLSTGCGGDDPESAVAALGQRFEHAMQERDIAGAVDAIDALRQVLPDTARSRLDLAKRLCRAGKISEALWLLEEAEKRAPGDVKLELGIAETALLVADGARALEALTKIGPDDPMHAYAMLLRSRAQLSTGDLEGSLATLREGRRLHPDASELGMAWIEALMSQGEYDEAMQAIAEVRRTAATTPAQRSQLDLTEAHALTQRSKSAAALARLDALLEREPTNTEAWRQRIQLMLARGEAERALSLLDEAIAVQPQLLDLRILRVAVLVAAGDLEEAAVARREVVRRVKGARARILLANRLHAAGFPDEALTVLDAAEPNISRRDAAEIAYMRVAFPLDGGRMRDARKRLADFQREFPKDLQLDLLRGRFEIIDGDPRAAAARLRRVASKLDRADVQHWLGMALEAAGDYAGAEYRYGMALQRDTRQVASLLGLVRTLERRAAWAQMMNWALRVIALEPDNAAGYDALVRALLAVKKPAQAEEVLRTYAERFPDQLAPVLGLSSALRAQSRPAEALSELEAGRVRFGTQPAFLAEQAFVLQALGRGAEAMAAIEKARGSGVRDANLERARAYLFFTAGRTERGGVAVEDALRLAPRDPTPLRMLGDQLMMEQNFESAERAYRRFLGRRPDDPPVLARLGDALARRDEREAAIEVYRKAIALDATLLPARNNLALLLQEQGRLDEALEAAQAAFSQAENEPIVMDTLGFLFVAKGLPERAVALLAKAERLAPDRPQVRYHLALAYREAGQPERARALLRALREGLEPGRDLYAEVERALASLPSSDREESAQ